MSVFIILFFISNICDRCLNLFKKQETTQKFSSKAIPPPTQSGAEEVLISSLANSLKSEDNIVVKDKTELYKTTCEDLGQNFVYLEIILPNFFLF